MTLEEDRARYLAALHAMQSGVAMEENYDPGPTSPKHLRVGVNSAMVEHGALIGLLMVKGVITAEEYYEALADRMEAERDAFAERISRRTGGNVRLV
jgi:hypothetical protein